MVDVKSYLARTKPVLCPKSYVNEEKCKQSPRPCFYNKFLYLPQLQRTFFVYKLNLMNRYVFRSNQHGMSFLRQQSKQKMQALTGIKKC